MMFSHRPLWQLLTITSLAALTAGCAGGIFNRYENMSFDAFINTLPMSELADTSNLWTSRAKAAPEQLSTLNEPFKDWCHARGGMWSSSSKVMRDLGAINAHTPTLPAPTATMACLAKDRQTFHGAYVAFNNKTVGFYTAAELLALETEVARISQVNQRKEDTERLRKQACLAEKAKLLRTETRVGMKTLGGTVIEIKQDMALLEVPSSTGQSIQYWTKLIYLEPPYDDQCNTASK